MSGGYAAERVAFLNGAEAVSFEVVKQSGRNTVAVVDAVQRELAAIGPTFPNDVRATLILECIME
jgi:hydrophobic/amphiphilic exporter-1 (mainly G- bacteria), HAE1 family